MARPSSPAIRAMKAKAWCWPSSRTARVSTSAKQGETVTILLNQTPFYGESGGQVGDAGKLTSLKGFEGEVEDTSKPLGKLHALAHQGREGRGLGRRHAAPAGRCRAPRRRPAPTTARPTCSTPRCAIGLASHVTQKGSLVAPDRLRFDFSHPKALTAEEIAADRGRRECRDPRQRAGRDPADDARRGGRLGRAGAVRREIWRRGPRAQSMGRDDDKHYSVELCGGTHVARDRRHPAVQDHLAKAPCPRACAGSRR